MVEIGVLPLVCGWWLDICSLSMFDTSFKDRLSSFRLAPGTSMFIHWLVGMVYVYYFASFVLLLREVVRPGVLWFLRNLNDPDFSPIQVLIRFNATLFQKKKKKLLVLTRYLLLFSGTHTTRHVATRTKAHCVGHDIWYSCFSRGVATNTNPQIHMAVVFAI